LLLDLILGQRRPQFGVQAPEPFLLAISKGCRKFNNSRSVGASSHGNAPRFFSNPRLDYPQLQVWRNLHASPVKLIVEAFAPL
jgi:hypothetical protein